MGFPSRHGKQMHSKTLFNEKQFWLTDYVALCNIKRKLRTIRWKECHMSRVTCHMSFFSFFGLIGEAYRWRVCYQQGLPRLVSSSLVHLLLLAKRAVICGVIFFYQKLLHVLSFWQKKTAHCWPQIRRRRQYYLTVKEIIL